MVELMTNPSKDLTNFLNFISDACSHYNYCCEELTKQEKLTQDYLHSLELDNLNYKERSKIATQLSINRKERRYYKDRIEELEPIVEFMRKAENARVIKNLERVLGACRKAENYHKNRLYIPKVLKKKIGE